MNDHSGQAMPDSQVLPVPPAAAAPASVPQGRVRQPRGEIGNSQNWTICTRSRKAADGHGGAPDSAIRPQAAQAQRHFP
jgi:hypothetical protein